MELLNRGASSFTSPTVTFTRALNKEKYGDGDCYGDGDDDGENDIHDANGDDANGDDADGGDSDGDNDDDGDGEDDNDGVGDIIPGKLGRTSSIDGFNS